MDYCGYETGSGWLIGLSCRCWMCKDETYKLSISKNPQVELHWNDPDVLKIVQNHWGELQQMTYSCEKHDLEYRAYSIRLPADIGMQSYLWKIWYAQPGDKFEIMVQYGFITRHVDKSQLLYYKAFDAMNQTSVYTMKIESESDFEDYVEWFMDDYKAEVDSHKNSVKTNFAFRVFPLTGRLHLVTRLTGTAQT